MAKVALELNQSIARRRELGLRGCAAPRIIGRGTGWVVEDVVCNLGPDDRPFEEQHASYTIAVVLAGSFQYRSRLGRAFMTPGSLMLGNCDECFECEHEHGVGDRCVSFNYAAGYFAGLAANAGVRKVRPGFTAPRIPALRAVAPIVASAAACLSESSDLGWEELGVELAHRALQLVSGDPCQPQLPRNAEARVTESVRMIERHPRRRLSLATLAEEARLSPYHFLRLFRRIAGVTPHQYVMRVRLREAAIRLEREPSTTVLDVAFDSGFGDLSNFNRTFRAEFGASPDSYRHWSRDGRRRRS